MNSQQRRAHRKLKRRYYDSLIAQKSYRQYTSRKTIKFYRKKGLNISEEYHRMPHEVDAELIASFANPDPEDPTGTHRFVVYGGTNDFKASPSTDFTNKVKETIALKLSAMKATDGKDIQG